MLGNTLRGLIVTKGKERLDFLTVNFDKFKYDVDVKILYQSGLAYML